MKHLYLLIFCGFFLNLSAQETARDTTCTTQLENMEAASLQELSDERQRLRYLRVVACKEIDSDLHKVTKVLGEKLTAQQATADEIEQYIGKSYFRGTLKEYESQEVTMGRGGKIIGKYLPPMFAAPKGEYYVVYQWYGEKDYLIFALKDGKVTESIWWHKDV